MNVIRGEITTDFSKPASGYIVNVGGGEVTFVLLTAGDVEAASLQFLDGPTSDSPRLVAPIKAIAGNSQVFTFPPGSLRFENGLFGILTGLGAQATVKAIIDV